MSVAVPPVVVFGYDFPHRKTQDVLLRLFLEGIPVKAVLAAPRVQLSTPSPTVRTKVRTGALLHPRSIADRIGAEYHVMPHKGENIQEYLAETSPALGVIAGARILPAPVIDAFEIGIVNLHPGRIPEVRGLDALLWAVRNDVPLGVTAHLIDERVDAGHVLHTADVSIAPDDTVFDLSERLYTTQLEILGPALASAVAAETVAVDFEGHPAYRKMPPDLEADTLAAVPDYVRRHAS